MNTTRSLAVASSLVLGLLVACSGSPAPGFGDDAGPGGPVPDTGSPHKLVDTGTATADGHVGTPDTGSTSSTGADTGTTGTDSSTGPEAAAGQCTPSCKMDSDCQNSCPAVSGALNCCDSQSGVCFTSSETVCPDQVPEAGVGTADTGSTSGY